jgi:hypothetical protein
MYNTGWFVKGYKNVQHVLPWNDSEEHSPSMLCPCGPFVTDDGIIVHNAFDLREYKEGLTEV